jgi:hypothetical protein
VRAADQVRYAVEVDVRPHRRLGWVEVGELVQIAGVDAYRLPPVDRDRPRYRLVGALSGLRAALLDWSSSDRDPDLRWVMDRLVEAVPVPSSGDDLGVWTQDTGLTAHEVHYELTRLEEGLLEAGSEIPLWVRCAGHLHEVRRLVQEHVGAEGSPPGAAVPYRARQRVVVLDLDSPHALAEIALVSTEVSL